MQPTACKIIMDSCSVSRQEAIRMINSMLVTETPLNIDELGRKPVQRTNNLPKNRKQKRDAKYRRFF